MTSLDIASRLGGCYYYNSENILPMVVVWGVNGYVSKVGKKQGFSPLEAWVIMSGSKNVIPWEREFQVTST